MRMSSYKAEDKSIHLALRAVVIVLTKALICAAALLAQSTSRTLAPEQN